MTDIEVQDQNPTRTGRRRQWIAGIILIIVAVFWFAAFMDRIIMPIIVLAGVEYSIPDFHHVNYNDAKKTCDSLGIVLDKHNIRIDDRLEPETILDQFPVAGIKVKPGKTVEVVVSERAMLIRCPNVVGRSPREASMIAGSAGLAVPEEKTRYRFSTRHPEGVVIAQEPDPETGMKQNDELILTVSLGKMPEKVIAPDLVGRKLDEVNYTLVKNNLRLGQIVRHPDGSVPESTVLSQDPKPGTNLKERDKVNIRISVKPASEDRTPVVKDSDQQLEEEG